MLNTKELPKSILTDLKNQGHSKKAIKQMTWEEAFDQWCIWHGIDIQGIDIRVAMCSLLCASVSI